MGEYVANSVVDSVRWSLLLLLLGFLAALSAAEEPLPRNAQFQINHQTAGNQLLPRVGALPGGGCLVVWHSDTSAGSDSSGSSIQARFYSSAGSPLGADFQVNTTTSGNQRGAAVAVDSLGQALVVWESESSAGDDSAGWSIQGRFVDFPTGPARAGIRGNTDFQVNTITSNDQRQPEVAISPTGELLVVWRSDTSAGSDTSGTSIQGRRLDSSVELISGESQIKEDFQINVYTTEAQSRPALTSTPDGGFVVVWESYGSADSDTSSWSIRARRFAADGMPSGTPFQVNAFTTSQQRDPAIVAAPTGNVLVTWQSSTSGESDTDWGIHGRFFDARNHPRGGQFQVNTTTFSDQYYSAVVHDGRGFLVTWKSFGSADDDPDLSIQIQRYAADGTALGGELQVNDQTAGAQKLPRIAKTDRGPVVVVWESETSPGSDTNGWSVQGRFLDLPIFRDGFESGDTSRWSASR